MKTNQFFLFIGIFLVVSLFPSCLDDDDDYANKLYPNALVTVKHADENSVFLQLDDNTTLFPVNLKSPPFGTKEVRALVNFEEVEESAQGYDKAVHVNWIDSIRTKGMVPDLDAKNDSAYGTDPVEIVRDWVTIAEDGYLTLRIRTIWGDQRKIHYVNLLAGGNPDDPYEVEFRHNASGDVTGRLGDALVAFKLDMLPDTEGKTVKLKLKWKSFSGEKSTEFDYSTRQATPPETSAVIERSMINPQQGSLR